MPSYRNLGLAAVLCGSVACADASPTAPAPASTPIRIVALGDSLTAGYRLAPAEAFPGQLELMLRQDGLAVQVRNAGVSGDTSGDGLRRLDAALASDPQILVLALGANDGIRGLPVGTMRANLARIIETARARGTAVLLCGMEAFPLHGWEYTIAFHEAFAELAHTYGLPMVPFLLEGVVGNSGLLLPDMVHPNAAGARVIAQNVRPYAAAMVHAASGQR